MIKFLHFLNIILFLASVIIPPMDIACPARGVVNRVVIYLIMAVLLINLFFIFYYNKSKETSEKKLKYLFIFYFCLMLFFGSIFFLWSQKLVC